MTKIHLMANNTRTTVITDSNKTIRQIFEENNVNYSVGTASVDGVSLNRFELDKQLNEVTNAEECWLSVIVKADNAATAKVEGAACIITSSVKLEDLNTVKKYRPEMLTLRNEEKEPVFMISLSKDVCGEISKFGVNFAKTPNSAGFATVTVLMDNGEVPMKEFVEDKIGATLLNLTKLEENMSNVLAEIKKEKDKIAEMITI